jgi:hypothetical protein
MIGNEPENGSQILDVANPIELPHDFHSDRIPIESRIFLAHDSLS